MEDVAQLLKVLGAETHGAQDGTGVVHLPYTSQLLNQHTHGKVHGLAALLKQNQLLRNQLATKPGVLK